MDISNHQHEFGKIIQEDVSCNMRPRLIRRCKICGYTQVVGLYGQISGHNFSKQEITKNSTCRDHGVAYSICSKCGEKKTVSLPLARHQYEQANPFYRTCTVCKKKQLTLLARRGIIVARASAILACIFFIALSALSHHLQSSISEENSIIAENIESSPIERKSETTLTTITASDNDLDDIAAQIVDSTNETTHKALQTKETYSVPVNNIAASESVIEEISRPDEPTEFSQTEALPEEATGSSQTEALSEETTATQIEAMLEESSGVSQTEALPEEASFAKQTETTIEIADITNETTLASATTATVATTATAFTTNETSFATNETTSAINVTTVATTETSSAAETSQDDYSYLIGRLIYGSEIFALVDTGAPIEVISSQGKKYYANTGSDTDFDESIISDESLYTVNLGTLGDLKIIIFNEL